MDVTKTIFQDQDQEWRDPRTTSLLLVDWKYWYIIREWNI